MTSIKSCPVPNYSAVFAGCTRKSLAQPGIIGPPLGNMAFVLVALKPDHDPQIVRNALVSLENIQVPPYTDANQQIFPEESKPQPPPLVSVYTFATRSNNLLPENALHFSIGFGYDLWVNKWNMVPPEGFIKFETMTNAYDQTPKPFSDLEDSNPLKGELYTANAFCIPEEKVVHDICIQMKSSSKPLIQRVAAHIAYVLESQSISVSVRMGFAKQRNQFGFYDGSSQAELTANPTLQAGCATRVWNTNKVNAIKNRAEFGDQYVDLGRIATTFIGEEASDEKFIGGTFAVVSHFVHDMSKWNALTIRCQENVFGRKKETSAFFTVADPLAGTINLNWPRSHIVRVHIRGQKVVEKMSGCPFTWLSPSAVQNNTDELEASSVPMEMYRQSCSFRDEETDLQGLDFFGYTRDCNIVHAMFERMIGYTSTLSDLPNGADYDPVIHEDEITGQKYYDCDKLMYYSKCIGTAYFYFPNMQELLGLSAYPETEVLKQPTSEESLEVAIAATKSKLRIGLAEGMECCKDTSFINLETFEIYRFLNDEEYCAPYEVSEDSKAVFDEDSKAGDEEVSNAVDDNIGTNSACTAPPDSKGFMQSDPLKEFMLSIVKANVAVAWKMKTGIEPVSMVSQKVIIVGAGTSGLLSALELKKIGVDVEILEASDHVGGRVHTLRFAQGLHAEAGAMRLPGSPDPQKRVTSHWLTDFFIELFDLEVAPFKNSDENVWMQAYNRNPVRSRNWGAETIILSNELYPGWDTQLEDGKQQITDKLKTKIDNKTRIALTLQLKLLHGIESIPDYYTKVTDIVVEDLTGKLAILDEEYEKELAKLQAKDDMSAIRKLYSYYVSEAEKLWTKWIEMWSGYTPVSFISSSIAEGEKLEHEISFIGLRGWPLVAVRGFTSLIYMPSPDEVSLVELLRDAVGFWWEDPMHTLRNGMDTLPRAFTNPNLWGPQSSSNMSWLLRDDVRYGQTVYKVDYSRNNDDGKVIVYAKNSTTSELFEYACDSVMLALPLPIIQNFVFIPALSAFKSEALRATRYQSSTKVLLQFRKRFWEVDIENNDERLPDDKIIQGGLSWTTAMVGQIVYPTPTNYLFPEDDKQPYFDWDFSDGVHLSDGSSRGLLVSYTWGKEAQRWAAQPEWKAVSVALEQLAELHSLGRYPMLMDEDVKESQDGNDVKRADYKGKILNLFESGAMQAWDRDEYSSSAFVLFGPNQYLEYWENLINWPEGNCKFADCCNLDDLKRLIAILAENGPPKFKASMNFDKFAAFSDDFKSLEKLGKVITDKSAQKMLHKCALQVAQYQDTPLYICGEAVSWCNGWIQGAFESALRGIFQMFDNYQRQNNPELTEVALCCDYNYEFKNKK